MTRQPLLAPAAPAVDPNRCEACRRTGVKVEWRQVSDGSQQWLCVNPTDCRRHWPIEPGRR